MRELCVTWPTGDKEAEKEFRNFTKDLMVGQKAKLMLPGIDEIEVQVVAIDSDESISLDAVGNSNSQTNSNFSAFKSTAVLNSKWAMKATEFLKLRRIEVKVTKIAEDSYYVQTNPPSQPTHFQCLRECWSPLGILKLGEEIKWGCPCGAGACIVSVITENASTEVLSEVGIECLKCGDIHAFHTYSQSVIQD